ncbi:MAG TPA: lysylphosphatidylglycerol synthase transmembrane domain-containing protein, partial [Solirubrobacteraceae bacterium]|nr:lysylphosphatidylglycerol synthase transmembrane domain-containing protein [Solirubrobacteraceae bacterium]
MNLGASSVADPAALPSDLSPKRLRRGALRLAGVLVVVGVVITLLPGLGSLRKQFAHAQAGWIVIGAAFEVLSILSYVPAFRVVFCRRMTWRTSYTIAMAEQGANSLLPVGGAGGLALGAWALHRGGMPSAEIARKTVAFFLLTSVPNVGTLVLVGLGLAAGIIPGHASLVLTLGPALVAAGAIVGTLALGRYARRLEARLEQRSTRSRERLASILRALADGIDEAVRLLRRGDPMLLLGLIGYMVFDILALWASFRALGSAPELAIVWIAYLIGQLGNLIPIPGGIGGVELGLIGMLTAYGLPVLASTAAVLLYRALELWIPAAFGLVAFVQLRGLLRRETDALRVCRPGDVVDVIGMGSVVAGSG